MTSPSKTSKPTLFIIGTPLQERAPLSQAAVTALEKSSVIVGESRKVTLTRLGKLSLQADVETFFLDGIARRENETLLGLLRRFSTTSKVVSLFSDCGMPLLFDPGSDVLKECRKLGYSIRSVPDATSWGTACALSLMPPPFLVVGFPPQKTENRIEMLERLRSSPYAQVFLDTPYRFLPLLGQCLEAFGSRRPAFLAWELGGSQEFLLWGSLGEIEIAAKQSGLTKGEFVLMVGPR